MVWFSHVVDVGTTTRWMIKSLQHHRCFLNFRKCHHHTTLKKQPFVLEDESSPFPRSILIFTLNLHIEIIPNLRKCNHHWRSTTQDDLSCISLSAASKSWQPHSTLPKPRSVASAVSLPRGVYLLGESQCPRQTSGLNKYEWCSVELKLSCAKPPIFKTRQQ